MQQPLDFFAKTVAEIADGGKWSPERFKQALDQIFAGASQDPEVEMIFLFRKGDNVGLIGLAGGELITTNEGFRSVLAPVFNRL